VATQRAKSGFEEGLNPFQSCGLGIGIGNKNGGHSGSSLSASLRLATGDTGRTPPTPIMAFVCNRMWGCLELPQAQLKNATEDFAQVSHPHNLLATNGH
jgi:hypothetical protein